MIYNFSLARKENDIQTPNSSAKYAKPQNCYGDETLHGLVKYVIIFYRMTSSITVISPSEIKPKYTNLEEYLLAECLNPDAWVEASVRCDNEGRILLMIDESEFIIEKLTGDPKIIIATAMKTDFLGYPTTKKMIQAETGHAITRPLTTVLRANLFMNSLSDFAEVKENFIVIHRTARIQRRVLSEIAPVAKDLVKTF